MKYTEGMTEEQLAAWKAYKRECSRRYREKHREQINEHHRLYRANNPERVKQWETTRRINAANNYMKRTATTAE